MNKKNNTKHSNRINFICLDKSKEFIEKFNKNVISEDFLKECEKASRLFNRKFLCEDEMINYKNFDMVVNKDFIKYDLFYRQILKDWHYSTDKENEKILIFCGENIEYSVEAIINECLNLESDSVKEIIEITQKTFKDKVIIELKSKTPNKERFLNIEISSIYNLEKIERGIKTSGIIFDVNDEYGYLMESIKEKTIVDKILPMFSSPTDLNFRFVLYY